MRPYHRLMRQKSWISRQVVPNLPGISLIHRDFAARILTINLFAAVILRCSNAARHSHPTSAAQHPRNVSGWNRPQSLCSAVLRDRIADSYRLSVATSRHRMPLCSLEISFTQTPPYLLTSVAMRVAQMERHVTKEYAQSQYR
jgi:hypothetical protein